MLNNNCLFASRSRGVDEDNRRFVLLAPSEHRRCLKDVGMFMKVARKTKVRGPNQVITAHRILPEVIGLQK